MNLMLLMMLLVMKGLVDHNGDVGSDEDEEDDVIVTSQFVKPCSPFLVSPEVQTLTPKPKPPGPKPEILNPCGGSFCR